VGDLDEIWNAESGKKIEEEAQHVQIFGNQKVRLPGAVAYERKGERI
jgi:deoxyhypusine synthase